MQYLIALVVFFAVMLYTTCCEKVYTKKEDISKANLYKVKWDDLEGFSDDDLETALEVFQKDCKRSIRYENLKEVCQRSFDAENGESFFTNNFTPYQLIGDENEEEGLITGYYEPLLKGSLTKTQRFKYPLYKTPDDLLIIDIDDVYTSLKGYRLRGKIKGNRVIPYDSREEIEKRDDLEAICYVDNKVDLFFLQIQGSGKVQLEDDTILNVGYAGQNGRKYYAIGRELVKKGYVAKEDISLQSIKKWLESNPSKMDEILNLNESYIFFRQSLKNAAGSLGSELTANRNLAVDRKYIPLGFPVFINTTNPVTNEKINSLTVAADTGGAIKGEIRADFFFGFGERAKELAGKMKQKGKLYLFIPNNI